MTLDPDVEAQLRSLMKERGMTFKEALNSMLRAGLQARPGRAPRKFRQRTFRMGFQPEAVLDKALTIAAALEDEEIVRKLSLRK